MSEIFLDPIDNDSRHANFTVSAGLDIGVLIRESNLGSVSLGVSAAILPETYLDMPNTLKSVGSNSNCDDKAQRRWSHNITTSRLKVS